MLVCYARELKEGFADYAEEVVKLMVPMLKFYFHDGVRSAAAESLPCLLDCAKIKGPQYLQGMWLYICPELIKAIDTEPENEVTVELMHSLSKVCMTKHISPTSTFLYHDFFIIYKIFQCIETLGAGCLSEEHMKDILTIINKMMNEHFERATERLEKRKDEDYDEVSLKL